MAAQLIHQFIPSEQVTPHSHAILQPPTPPPPLAAQLLHHFIPSEQITPHTCNILPALAAQLLAHSTLLWTNYPSLSHHFTPLAAQLLLHFTPSGQITYSLLHHFTLLDSSTLSSFHTPLDKLPPHSCTILTPWQSNSYTYINLPPLNKNSPILHHFTSLAAELLLHFTPSGQITYSLLHHFTPLDSSTLSSFYTPLDKLPLSHTILPPWQPNSYFTLPPLDKLPTHSYTILPFLTAQLLAHFIPLWTNYPLILAPFQPPWQSNSYTYINLPPINKNSPILHHFTSLAAQLLLHFTPSEQIIYSLLHHFTPLDSSTLSSFYTPLDKLPLHSYTILPPLAA